MRYILTKDLECEAEREREREREREKEGGKKLNGEAAYCATH